MDLKIPYLPARLETGSLIVPVGTWEGWYFSDELEYAMSLGYKITHLNNAYLFDKGKPFNE